MEVGGRHRRKEGEWRRRSKGRGRESCEDRLNMTQESGGGRNKSKSEGERNTGSE